MQDTERAFHDDEGLDTSLQEMPEHGFRATLKNLVDDVTPIMATASALSIAGIGQLIKVFSLGLEKDVPDSMHKLASKIYNKGQEVAARNDIRADKAWRLEVEAEDAQVKRIREAYVDDFEKKELDGVDQFKVAVYQNFAHAIACTESLVLGNVTHLDLVEKLLVKARDVVSEHKTGLTGGFADASTADAQNYQTLTRSSEAETSQLKSQNKFNV